MRQFGERSIGEYLALVRGEPPSTRGRVEALIGRDSRDRQRMAVVAGGREAITGTSCSAGPPVTTRSLPCTR